MAVRSPTLIGRDDELTAIRHHLERARHGDGGLVFVVGDAGSGKSRLVHESLADDPSITRLHGRAVDSPNPVAYRPLTEAFQTAFRGIDRPDDVLEGLATHVGAIVPAWAPAAATTDAAPAVVVGEAAIRLLRVAAPGQSVAVLVLEDLHWADPETLELVDLLADASLNERILTICTSRPIGAATGLVQRLGRRSPGSSVELDPLEQPAIHSIVAGCLGAGDPPPGLVDFVDERSDGNPFLVEELLAGLVASGDLRQIDGLWSVGELRATVPSSLQASIHGRLRGLDATAIRVLGAAALLGREFEWEVLPGIAEADGRSVVDALRAGADVGIIEVRESAFRFHHALTREAVLGELLPPEVQQLAARAWPVIERANPGLPGPSLELAADLAERAGDRAAAVALLVVSARRAVASGAVATAESTARHAVRLAQRSPALVDAEGVLLEVLVAAGKVSEALALGRDLSGRIDASVSATALVEHHLTLATAAVSAGELAIAGEEVQAARTLAGEAPETWLAARIDVVGAHVALDSGDLTAASQYAERGRTAADATGQFDVVCDATLVLGRVVRPSDWQASIVLFEDASRIAERAGLATWHLRARQELASSTWLTGDMTPLVRLRTTALRYGAITTATQIDLTLADIALSMFDTAGCRRAASDCATVSRRYHLAAEPVAHLWLAGAFALAGDDPSMQSSIDEALAADPDDPRILGDLYGRVLWTRALVQDELDTIPALLDTMAEHVRRSPPGTSVYPGRVPRALIHVIDGDDRAAESRHEVELLAGPGGMPYFAFSLELVDAVAAGRDGRVDEAEARFARAYDTLATSPLGAGPVHSLSLLFAPAAHRDGWGDPASWLRTSEAWFDARGHVRIARRCRLLLGEVGAPVPRRGRGRSAVPEGLRAMGVTSREVDVLQLVVAGRSNRAIAEELVLSSKTVERHLSNLFVRTGATNRQQLVALTAPHLGSAIS